MTSSNTMLRGVQSATRAILKAKKDVMENRTYATKYIRSHYSAHTRKIKSNIPMQQNK